ncbi:MAG: tRNA (adenosine(37)-N6)-dimethylallyltransferase MiaA [Desulfuromonadales bacterium C00003068]|jgi:tRNA dimethylallyltransferase|nr:MAG: tRNA (adenosine(37)-N6)-dimethylallyltransferase MiaA [Desulfuromonadales bacterium C00003068]
MMVDKEMPIIVIGGPTASGKTDFALKLAEHYPVEVVSADSRQVYRQMDIGTAKVTRDEQRAVHHHLINIIDPDQDISVADFTQLAHVAIKDILNRKKIPVVVGGTGLYIRALTDGLLDGPAENGELRAQLLADESMAEGILHQRLIEVDPLLAHALHRRDLTRIVRGLEVFEATGTPLSELQKQHGFMEQPYRALKFALSVERPLLYDRINRRVHAMVESGLIDETQLLLARGYGAELKSMKTIGYRQIVAHLCEGLSIDDAISWIQRDSRRYAKRQMTWFRKDKSINWVDCNDDFVSILKWIDRFLFN